MTVLDANVLLYAYNLDAPQQGMAAEWMKAQIINHGKPIV
jgi:hypothetical protein